MKKKHNLKIHYTYYGRAFITLNGSRLYLDECMKAYDDRIKGIWVLSNWHNVQAMNYDCGFSDHLEIEEVIL
jgi:hypothetical protein